MNSNEYIYSYLIVFFSSNHSMALYKILKDDRYDVLMQPTPCTISAGCANAISFRKEDLEPVLNEIDKSNIPIQSIYVKLFDANCGKFKYAKYNRTT